MLTSRQEIIDKAKKLEQCALALEKKTSITLAKARKTLKNPDNPEEIERTRKAIDLNENRRAALRNIRNILLQILGDDKRKLSLEIIAKLTESQREAVAELKFNPNSAGDHEFARHYKDAPETTE